MERDTHSKEETTFSTCDDLEGSDRSDELYLSENHLSSDDSEHNSKRTSDPSIEETDNPTSSSDNNDSDDDEPSFGDSNPSNSEVNSEFESSSEEEMNFDSAALNVRLRLNSESTVKEALVLNLAAASRSNLEYESIVRYNRILNILFNRKYMADNKKRLWKHINKKSGGMTFYAYCSFCSIYLMKMKKLKDGDKCPGCGNEISRRNVKTFVSLSLRKQFEAFLKIPGIGVILAYKNRRIKKFPDSLEDVFDSKYYKYLSEHNIISPNDFIYAFNTDGFKLFESSNASAWPLFVRLLDLPPHLRQKHMFLAGLCVCG